MLRRGTKDWDRFWSKVKRGPKCWVCDRWELQVKMYWRDYYKETILKIGNWSLRRRSDVHTGKHYRAMIGHSCSETGSHYIRNGVCNSGCSDCRQDVPDEIQGLWWLLCNDQYEGRDDGE